VGKDVQELVLGCDVDRGVIGDAVDAVVGVEILVHGDLEDRCAALPVDKQ
jgi:hypothetical protein